MDVTPSFLPLARFTPIYFYQNVLQDAFLNLRVFYAFDFIFESLTHNAPSGCQVVWKHQSRRGVVENESKPRTQVFLVFP